MKSLLCCAPAALAALLVAPTARGDLASFVKERDDAFAWSVQSSSEIPGVGTALVVRLVSQKWQGIVWEHWMHVIRPEKVTRPEHALLVISGGSRKSEPPQKIPTEAMALGQLAAREGTLVVILGQVPNQPLFGNLKEDALIAHTFQKYYETKDETWPALLPMTRSAVRAMDAVEALAKEKYHEEVKHWVVTGASKRGWTTWLTGAVDPRVEAIAPMVIDTLNMTKQMPHQLRSFGKYSEQIQDYTALGLQEKMVDPASKRLLELVDPYSYRQRLTMPKLILLGTNDRYWPVDAVKLYFPDLPGEKHLLHVPNAGHNLGPPLGVLQAVATLGAFYHQVIAGVARPSFDWTLQRSGSEALLTLLPKDAPEKVELWKASADTLDFRDARWSGADVEKGDGKSVVLRIPVPGEGYSAFFARLTYKSSSGDPYCLTTNVEVLGEKSKARAAGGN